MSAPVAVVMARAAALAASRLGGEPVSREARGPTSARQLSARRTAAVVRRRPARLRTCTYCPNRALHGSPTCWGHQDLLALDPFFSPDIPQEAEPIEDVFPDVLPDRLQTAGG